MPATTSLAGSRRSKAKSAEAVITNALTAAGSHSVRVYSLTAAIRGSNLLFLFADCELDSDRRELRRGSQPVAVEPQVFDVLIYLLQNIDRVVTRDDLIASVWGGRIVEDTTLTNRIFAARKAIGDSGRNQKLIRQSPAKAFDLSGRCVRGPPRERRGSISVGG